LTLYAFALSNGAMPQRASPPQMLDEPHQHTRLQRLVQDH